MASPIILPVGNHIAAKEPLKHFVTVLKMQQTDLIEPFWIVDLSCEPVVQTAESITGNDADIFADRSLWGTCL